MPNLQGIQTALDRAVAQGVFPGAVLGIRCGGGPIFHACTGQLSTAPPGAPVHPSTIYDLASLTKPLATVTSLAVLIQKGRCRLDDCVTQYIPECAGTIIQDATLRHLLMHASGLPGWRGFYERLSPDGVIPSTRDARHHAKQSMLRLIASESLVYERGTRSLYSDLGFMLLGIIIERCSEQLLDDFFHDHLVLPLGGLPLQFVLAERHTELLDVYKEGGVAPTEVDSWRGRLLCGEVHDQNAASLGGVAGHAGLFGTVDAVLAITGEWLRGYSGRVSLLQQGIVQEFTRRQRSDGVSSWALGWDTPSIPSSAGHYFSPRSFGHLGYTGTSIWMDPDHELEVVLLSNRVHPTSKNNAIREVRPVIHDLVYQEFIGAR